VFLQFNQQCDWASKPTACYEESVDYRVIGAQAVSKVGGLACLIRSVASFSINSPHTGASQPAAVPAAALTVEDVAMLARMQARGQHISLTLKMSAVLTTTTAVGHNVVAEITGSELPHEVVLESGHLDSWDVGQGAMDDGGGMAISWMALAALRSLGLRPRRTLRLVLWSCEEFGGVGAQQYFDAHQKEASNMSIVMESDMGVFAAQGLQLTASPAATAIVTQIGQLLRRINATAVTPGGDGTDIAPWMSAGVPGASLLNHNERYFWFHHSDGDTMSVLNSDDVDRCAAVWAVHAYTIANLAAMLPR